jgi:hypothetical protein
MLKSRKAKTGFERNIVKTLCNSRSRGWKVLRLMPEGEPLEVTLISDRPSRNKAKARAVLETQMGKVAVIVETTVRNCSNG